ncbi:MAG: NADH-quinone oxidoreductase subunit L [Deltaproteobacteria bacterium]|nr:NADH-quinone oxidoreductase subunit L [Deltaproteobacteria bacterium]
MEFAVERTLLWIVLLPLAGAIINGLAGRYASRTTVHTVAVGSVAMAFGLALLAFVRLYLLRAAGEQDAKLIYTLYEWFAITVNNSQVSIPVRFIMDALGGAMTLVVSGVGLLIHIYACGYMKDDPSYARFFSYMNLFMASMLLLVLASNVPLMFVGWEGVGLCSYLLIGFWFENKSYAEAGRKAFITNRIGDFGVLIAMFLLVQAVGSFEFETINRHAVELAGRWAFGLPALRMTVATVATLFLFLGCTGKSAQIPLFVWLPDAMAGPTPVSALIHAATMVTSGVYLICRLSPVFAVAPTSMAVVAIIGTATAFLAATIALVQNNMKRILAYSTVSQLGFMFAAAGCGAFAAGFFHVYTHAFFKACLFLGAGSVMHAVGAHGDADIRQLGGLRRFQPRTNWTFLASCLAIAGVPLFSGFFSKDEILVGALSVGDFFFFAPWLGRVLFAVLVIAAILTAFYMFRLYFMTFWGDYRGGPSHDNAEHGGHDPHESPGSMTWPLVLLGVGAIVGGYLWVGALGLLHLHWEPWVVWLEPSLASIGTEHHTSHIAWALGLGTTAAVVGIGIAWSWYARKDVETPKRLKEQFPEVHQFLMDKWRVDELYDATILGGSRRLGIASANFDNAAIDGLLASASSKAVKGLSYLFTRIQTGVVHAYGAIMVAGIVAVAWWFIFPHARIDVQLDENGLARNPVHLAAGEGLGYEYQWDIDSDGTFETDWQSGSKLEHRYSIDELKPGSVVIFAGSGYGVHTKQSKLMPGEPFHLDENLLGSWQHPDEYFKKTYPKLVGVLPKIEADEDGGVIIRPNGAVVARTGKRIEREETIRVRPGESVSIGEAKLTIAGYAQATVAVKNAFGLISRDSITFTIARDSGSNAPQAYLGGTR